MERHKSFKKHRLLAKCNINSCNNNKIDEKLRWSIELRKYMYEFLSHSHLHTHTILFPLFLTLCKLLWEHLHKQKIFCKIFYLS